MSSPSFQIRRILRNPWFRGVVVFLFSFVLASVLGNFQWQQKRGVALRREVLRSIDQLRSRLADHEPPALSPWRAVGSGPYQGIVEAFLEDRPPGQILQLLRDLMLRHSVVDPSRLKLWKNWRSDLEQLVRDEGELIRSNRESEIENWLVLARMRIARGQGAISSGDSDRGLVNMLGALRAVRHLLQRDLESAESVEASFIGAKVLYFVFHETEQLEEVRNVGLSSVWSIRAAALLRGDES